MSNKSLLNAIAGILVAGAMVLSTGAAFAQDFQLWRQNFGGNTSTSTGVTESDEEGLYVTLPGEAQIGGDSGPQATTPPSAAATFSSFGRTLSVGDDCDDRSEFPTCD